MTLSPHVVSTPSVNRDRFLQITELGMLSKTEMGDYE